MRKHLEANRKVSGCALQPNTNGYIALQIFNVHSVNRDIMVWL